MPHKGGVMARVTSKLYTNNGRLYVCLVEQVLMPTDPENTHYAVMRDSDGLYAPFLVDLTREPDFRQVA